MSDHAVIVDVHDSQCATCGKDMSVVELVEDDGKTRFRGGCFLSALNPDNFVEGPDTEYVFYQECKDCCPVCNDS